MSQDPSLDLQKAIRTALQGNAGVAALVGGRIKDNIKVGTEFPYISFGSDQVFQDDFECMPGFEVFVTLDVWSRAVGQPEMKRISGAIRQALHGADLVLDSHALVDLQHDTTRYLDGPDGVTSHGVITFRALVETA